MADFNVLSHSAYRRLPWKNGLGETREIVIHPPDRNFAEGDFDFRVSRATVDRDSEFSRFPDHDRVLVIKNGAGLRLLGDGRDTTLHALRPFRFSGAEALRAELLAGPIEDLNIFFRRVSMTAEVEVRDVDIGTVGFAWSPRARWAYAFALNGDVAFRIGEKRGILADGDTLAVDAVKSVRFFSAELEAKATLALLEFDPRP